KAHDERIRSLPVSKLFVAGIRADERKQRWSFTSPRSATRRSGTSELRLGGALVSCGDGNSEEREWRKGEREMMEGERTGGRQ
ncbi:hypothetical protein PanWU01x14_091920, partial [Parasponia andersonii]